MLGSREGVLQTSFQEAPGQNAFPAGNFARFKGSARPLRELQGFGAKQGALEVKQLDLRHHARNGQTQAVVPYREAKESMPAQSQAPVPLLAIRDVIHPFAVQGGALGADESELVGGEVQAGACGEGRYPV